ncbi:unnamed protein product [Adineta ricciae]|uniref:F-box domain-containing protein n=1 Tax=Adineta ricciae TaxID=249248 RepID=A0A814Z9L8_ADIRI|nr:unnamed protein product [Adineta ricciae]
MSEKKRFKRELTVFENLPNEIIIDVFDYLNGVDTVYGFDRLNYRFQCLLNDFVKNFDFQSVSKAKLEAVIALHDMHRWRSLCLSNESNTCGQIQFFCESYPLVEHVSQLQSLTIIDMSKNYQERFFRQMRSFDNLVSLSVGNICGVLVQSIRLPSLKQLNLTSCGHTQWITNFHSLEKFRYKIISKCHRTMGLIFPTTLVHLKVTYNTVDEENILLRALSQLSQLRLLSVCNTNQLSRLPDGVVWEKLIVSSLPLLHTFQFYFPYEQGGYLVNGDLNQTIASFSTPFYLVEKRWFIQCDRDLSHQCRGAIYSLPFAFSTFYINSLTLDTSISTLPLDNGTKTRNHFYSKINTLVLNENCEVPYNGLMPSNIVHLTLNSTLSSNWFYFLPVLRDLHVTHNSSMTKTEFGRLLEYALNLRSLTIASNKLKELTDNYTDEAICNRLSDQIISLTLDDPNSNLYTVSYMAKSNLPLSNIFNMEQQQQRTGCQWLHRLINIDICVDWWFFVYNGTIKRGLVFGPPRQNTLWAIRIFCIIATCTSILEIIQIIRDTCQNRPTSLFGQITNGLTLWFEDVPLLTLNLLIVICRDGEVTYISLTKAIIGIIASLIRFFSVLLNKWLIRHDYQRKDNLSKFFNTISTIGVVFVFILSTAIHIIASLPIDSFGHVYLEKPSDFTQFKFAHQKYFHNVGVFLRSPKFYEKYIYLTDMDKIIEKSPQIFLYTINHQEDVFCVKRTNRTCFQQLNDSDVQIFDRQLKTKSIDYSIAFQFQQPDSYYILGDIHYNVIRCDDKTRDVYSDKFELHYFRFKDNINQTKTPLVNSQDQTYRYYDIHHDFESIEYLWRTGLSRCSSTSSYSPHRSQQITVNDCT